MDLNNKRERWLFAVVVGVLSIILAALAFHFPRKKHTKELGWNFKGPVEKIYYSYQGIPYVTVNGREYDLMNVNYTFYHRIKKGDTIIKQKGDIRIKIIRPHSRDTIYDRNPKYDPLNFKPTDY